MDNSANERTLSEDKGKHARDDEKYINNNKILNNLIMMEKRLDTIKKRSEKWQKSLKSEEKECDSN